MRLSWYHASFWKGVGRWENHLVFVLQSVSVRWKNSLAVSITPGFQEDGLMQVDHSDNDSIKSFLGVEHHLRVL